MLPLEMLRPGEWAEVAHVHGEPSWVGRMGELGIRTGCRVQMVQPGTPCLLQVENCRLSLRGDCNCQVLVTLVDGFKIQCDRSS